MPRVKNIALLAALLLTAEQWLSGLGADAVAVELPQPTPAIETLMPAGAEIGASYSDGSDGGHAIHAAGEAFSCAGATLVKTGSVPGEDADFSGENAAVLAEDGALLTLRAVSVSSEGTHANAVFSRGEGTRISIADSTVVTGGSCSGGLISTDGGTVDADNLVVHTSGRSSAAIRADRGGSVTVRGGTCTADGVDSPAVSCSAGISVSDAELSSGAAQGVVVEGSGSAVLSNVTLTANGSGTDSGRFSRLQAGVLCRPGSRGADGGAASFRMEGGSLTNLNGDVFLVADTEAEICLSSVQMLNADPDGVLLRAAAVSGEREGAEGGHAVLCAAAQELAGDLLTDGRSSLTLCLTEGSRLQGAVNPDGTGRAYVELTGDSKWILTGDSHVTGLCCAADSIVLNGFSLTVDGEAYTEGTAFSDSCGPAAASECSAVPEGEAEALGGDGKRQK